MSFEILIETWEAEGRVVNMINKLQVLPVPAELTEWQTEDMKRKIPNTETINPTAAMTVIWPRGRTKTALRNRPLKRPSVFRSKTWSKPRIVQRYRTGGQQATTSRPILRPALYEKLRDRMSDMMQREIKW